MRKLIEFDDETMTALKLLSSDSMTSFQELADEAFRDLLKKHNRPTNMRQAFRESARRPLPGAKRLAAKAPPGPKTKPKSRSRPA
jgi:hypothetical protein